MYSIRIKNVVDANKRQVIHQTLRDKETVKRIAMMKWKLGNRKCMTERYIQDRDVVGRNLVAD